MAGVHKDSKGKKVQGAESGDRRDRLEFRRPHWPVAVRKDFSREGLANAGQMQPVASFREGSVWGTHLPCVVYTAAEGAQRSSSDNNSKPHSP